MKKALPLFVVIFFSAVFTNASTRTSLSEYKSDFICLFDDPSGMRSDEGYTLNMPQEEALMPEVRFVQGEFVKYSLDCLAETKENIVSFFCGFPRGDDLLLLDFSKDTLRAEATYL